MRYQEFFEEIHWRGGFKSRRETAQAIRATLLALGQRLLDQEREALKRGLPEEDRSMLDQLEYAGDFGLGEFYDRVQRIEKLPRGFSMEHAQVVCQALASLLDDWALQRLKNYLPGEFAVLLESPDRQRRHPVEIDRRKRPFHGGGARESTLAGGKPWSSRTLSEARPGQLGSPDVSPDPHRERKLSSGRLHRIRSL